MTKGNLDYLEGKLEVKSPLTEKVVLETFDSRVWIKCYEMDAFPWVYTMNIRLNYKDGNLQVIIKKFKYEENGDEIWKKLT